MVRRQRRCQRAQHRQNNTADQSMGDSSAISQPLSILSANVGTLRPKDLKVKILNAGAGITPRMVEFDAQFHAAGVHLAGIQESRIQGDGMTSCEHFEVYRGSADAAGCDGCQIWVSKALRAQVTATVPISPRLFTLTASICDRAWHVTTAHAPIEDASHEVKLEFWDSLDTELTRATASTYDNMVLCIDANARVGSHTSTAIGPCCPAMESENGMILRSILEMHGLLALNTFMDGSPTWIGPLGHL